MEFLEKSAFRDNTLLVLTADQTAYPEPPLLEACHGLGCSKFFIDKIPLVINQAGKIQPRRVDAQGRNSLDLAPTLLQILGIRNHPNSFLGSTLFERKANSEVNVSMVRRAPLKTDSDTVIAVPTVGTSVDGWGRPAVLNAAEKDGFRSQIERIQRFYGLAKINRIYPNALLNTCSKL